MRIALRSWFAIGAVVATLPFPAFTRAAGAVDPLQSVDRNRNTIVERIVSEWGDALAASGASVSKSQLRELLLGLRADGLLAASLTGSLDGLRAIVADAVDATRPAAGVRAKDLGDVADDLVYTPVVPCRILDTRFATGGSLQAGQQRNWVATNPGGNFTAQGGVNGDCGVTVKPAAVMINFTLANTTGAANFMTAWPFSIMRPNAATLNWTAPGQQIANAIALSLCVSCGADFSTYASAKTDLIADLVGYFAAPANAVSGTGTAGYFARWGPTDSTLTDTFLFEDVATGYIGLGAGVPHNRLEIGIAPGFVNNHLAMGNGNKGMSFSQSDTASTWFSSTNFVLQPVFGGSGLVGIATATPNNRLEIGPAAGLGFGGNDIAFSNHSQGSSFAQGASTVTWTSTTDMILMPRANTHGRVGINTSTPGYPLEVDDSVVYVSVPVSIYTPNYVMAVGYVTLSDARMKDVAGASDSAADLDTLMRLQVSDYVLKPAPASTGPSFKKLVAQQVETVYPQVVSRHRGYVPDIDQTARVAARTERGLLLRFERDHGLGAQAQRLKLVDVRRSVTRQVAIVAVPSSREVEIEPVAVEGDEVFVYGEEVDDLRSVDYDGLSALNISATQELARRLRAVEEQNALLRAALADQSARLAVLEAKDRAVAAAATAVRVSR